MAFLVLFFVIGTAGVAALPTDTVGVPEGPGNSTTDTGGGIGDDAPVTEQPQAAGNKPTVSAPPSTPADSPPVSTPSNEATPTVDSTSTPTSTPSVDRTSTPTPAPQTPDTEPDVASDQPTPTTDETVDAVEDTASNTGSNTISNLTSTNTTSNLTSTDTVSNLTSDTPSANQTNATSPLDTNSTLPSNDTGDEPLETVQNSTNETTTTVENAANETIAGGENLTSNITGEVQNATNEPAEAIETITSETVDTVEETTTGATAGVGKTVTIVPTDTVNETLWRVDDTAETSRTLLAQSIADEHPTSARITEDRRTSGGHVIQQEIDNDAPRNTSAAVAPPAPPSETGISNSRPAMGLSAWVGVILFGGIVRHLLATGSILGAMPVQAGTTGGAFRRLFRLAVPLRYSKWDDSDPLDHERRQQVYETITESPGTYLSELSEELDIHRSTLRHHIKILEREQLVTRANVNGRSRIFPAFTEQKELRVALNDDATAPIVTALARLGQADCSTLASELDKDTSTLSYHLQRLEQNGVIERFRDGRSKVNRLTGDASHALTATGSTSESGLQSSRFAD